MWRVLRHAGLSLSAGAVLYLGFRAETLLGWHWAASIGVDGVGLRVRAALAPLAPYLPDWALFTLPDALWVYALTFVVAHLVRSARPVERGLWLTVVLALGPGAELGQAVGLVPGTFDPADLVATLVAFAGALYLARPPRPLLAPTGTLHAPLEPRP